MKRASVLLVALILAAGCGDSDTAPATIDDNRVQFSAALTTANEVPPLVNATEAGASGTANIDFNLTKDAAGTITAATAHFRVDLTGFPAGSAITAAHIHTGAAGVQGPVLVSAQVASGEVALTGGVGTFSRLSIPITPVANAQAIINNPAGFYFNVHTQANTSGVIRGQLVRK